MLYEVITINFMVSESGENLLEHVEIAGAYRGLHAHFSKVAGQHLRISDCFRVITSYSIHYTKLYDSRIPAIAKILENVRTTMTFGLCTASGIAVR